MTNKITHNGKQYEKGKIYICSTTEKIGILSGKVNGLLSMSNKQVSWHTDELEMMPSNMLGIITDAPRPDGWYMCKWQRQTGNESFEHPQQPFFSKNGQLLDAPEDEPFFQILYKMERAK